MCASALSLSAGQIAGLMALNSGLSLGSGLFGSYLGSANSSKAMKQQFHYNMAMLEQQFKYNNYIQQHSHQHEVYDLKHAGLNPILSANGGNTMPVGLPSVSAVENSGGMANTMSDAVNTAMQNVNTAFANNTSAKAVENAKPVQDAQAKLFGEQALTEFNKRSNLDEDTNLKKLTSAGKVIENSYLPEKLKSEILLNVNSAKGIVANSLANMISAHSNEQNAGTNRMNAETNRVKAYKEDLLNKGIDFYRKTNWNNAMRDIMFNTPTGKHFYKNWSPLKKR